MMIHQQLVQSSSEQQDSGFSASYTMGGMTIAGHMNESENVGGSTAASAIKNRTSSLLHLHSNLFRI